MNFDLNKLTKQQIEKGKFRLTREVLNSKARSFLGTSQLYILHFKEKRFYFYSKYRIVEEFRRALNEVYGRTYFKDLPDSYFKRYIHKDFLKKGRKNKLTLEKKKPYYRKLNIKKRKAKIKRMQEEIKILRGSLKNET